MYKYVCISLCISLSFSSIIHRDRGHGRQLLRRIHHGAGGSSPPPDRRPIALHRVLAAASPDAFADAPLYRESKRQPHRQLHNDADKPSDGGTIRAATSRSSVLPAGDLRGDWAAGGVRSGA